MKKNKIIKFSLIIVAILLFFFTYYSKDKDAIVDTGTNIITEDSGKLTKETSNIIENVSYVGTDNKGTFFELKAALAEIKYDKPNISLLQDVLVVIKMNDFRKIYIRSDKAVYNKLSNDCEFIGHVKITERDNIITSDNLNLYMSKNLITAYNNVKYNGIQGLLIADKVDIDMLTNEANIFMFKTKDKVKVKYNN